MQGKKPDEDIRLPMQWSAQAYAGFSASTPWRAPASSYPKVNVEAETGDPASLFSFYQQMIAIRKQSPAIQSGSVALVTANNKGVYTILRSSGNENILIVINLTKNPIKDYNLSVKDTSLPDGQYSLEAIFGSGSQEILSVLAHGFDNFKPVDELPPYSVSIFNLIP
jgi:alpha-amylase